MSAEDDQLMQEHRDQMLEVLARETLLQIVQDVDMDLDWIREQHFEELDEDVFRDEVLPKLKDLVPPAVFPSPGEARTALDFFTRDDEDNEDDVAYVDPF